MRDDASLLAWALELESVLIVVRRDESPVAKVLERQRWPIAAGAAEDGRQNTVLVLEAHARETEGDRPHRVIAGIGPPERFGQRRFTAIRFRDSQDDSRELGFQRYG